MARENDPAAKAVLLENEIMEKLKTFEVDVVPVWTMILEYGFHRWSTGYDAGLNDGMS